VRPRPNNAIAPGSGTVTKLQPVKITSPERPLRGLLTAPQRPANVAVRIGRNTPEIPRSYLQERNCFRFPVLRLEVIPPKCCTAIGRGTENAAPRVAS